MIIANSITKAFEGRTLWTHLSFTVPAGTMLGIVAPSGTGKTTLLHCIGGLESIDSGELLVDQRAPGQLRGRQRTAFFRRTLVFLFQHGGLVDEWTVEDNLNLAIEATGMDRSDAAQARTTALDRVGMADALHAPVHRLSGGERQRAALARAMLKPGHVILADEPSSALDDGSCDVLSQYLLEQCQSGSTVVLASHDPRLLKLCDATLNLATSDGWESRQATLTDGDAAGTARSLVAASAIDPQ